MLDRYLNGPYNQPDGLVAVLKDQVMAAPTARAESKTLAELTTDYLAAHPDADNMPLLRAVMRGGWVDVQERLLSAAKPPLGTEAGRVLVEAAPRSHLVAVARLLELGAPVDFALPQSRLTALAAAADLGNVEMTALLLDAGARPDIVDARGRAMLHRAAHFRRGLELYPLWLKLGVAPEATNADGLTASRRAGKIRAQAAEAQVGAAILAHRIGQIAAPPPGRRVPRL